MKLLIADDSRLSRTALKDFFNGVSQIEISEAANGIEVLEEHRVFQPDVIFMDIAMPLLDGMAALKILSMIDKQVKVVVVSSIGDQQSVKDDCLRHGALPYYLSHLRKRQCISYYKSSESR